MENDQTLRLDSVGLQSGAVLPEARLAYKTYGRLSPARDNVIVYPTRFGGTVADNEYLIGAGRALDPERYFIVVPNLLGNGVSSSPSNTPEPHGRGGFPHVTTWDNVRLQHRLLTEVFEVSGLVMAVGWSMGAQAAYHWASLYPDMVPRLAVICGSARTAAHNFVFLEGMKAALTADAEFRDGWYEKPPARGLCAIARAWAGWGLSQTWYRQGLYRSLGYDTLERWLVEYWEALYLGRDANNILAMIWTWQHADISDNDVHRGDLAAALAAIQARTFLLPVSTDLYFPPEDNADELPHLRDAELRPIESIWGHYAGGGRDPAALDFIDRQLKELLAA